MSYYYKCKFTSPEPIYAAIREELRSYFEAGIVDDALFARWTGKCIGRLGVAAYPIQQAVLKICDYKSILPTDFHATREAWMCTDYISDYQLPSSLYTQIKTTSTNLTSQDQELACQACTNCDVPDVIEAIYKTTQTVYFRWKKQFLLKPGNIYPACPTDMYCANYNAVGPDSYDIRDGNFVTTFREGTVYLQYYSIQDDECSNQLIPDEFRVKEYVEAFIKQKLFEQIFNQTTDESFKQSESKYLYYTRLADEAYIIADTENKKEDVYRKQRATKRVQNRFRGYDIR